MIVRYKDNFRDGAARGGGDSGLDLVIGRVVVRVH